MCLKSINRPIYEQELIIYMLVHNILNGDEILIDSKELQALSFDHVVALFSNVYDSQIMRPILILQI